MSKLEIIAEISGNHGGNKQAALELIGMANRAGFTGVKFQCFEPEQLAIKRADYPRIKAMGLAGIVGAGMPVALNQLYRETHTPKQWFPDLIAQATNLGLTWHASAFSREDVDFLRSVNCPRIKISAFEAHDINLVSYVRALNLPIIMSVNQDEDVAPPPTAIVLHATNYSVPPENAKLKRMRYWYDSSIKYQGHWKWGLSDHTLDGLASTVAASFGASMIEWHIKHPLIKSPDEQFSWDPDMLMIMIARVHRIRQCLWT
jgi:pseudaminic acid synthase